MNGEPERERTTRAGRLGGPDRTGGADAIGERRYEIHFEGDGLVHDDEIDDAELVDDERFLQITASLRRRARTVDRPALDDDRYDEIVEDALDRYWPTSG